MKRITPRISVRQSISRSPKRGLSAALVALSAMIVFASTCQAQTLTVIQNFSAVSGPQYPTQGALAQGRDGKLYGTSFYPNYGLVYSVSTRGIGRVVYSFDGASASSPNFGVTMATDGRFYGGTNEGGSSNYGVLFRVTSGGTFEVLHEFQGASDGSRPIYPPVEASTGTLYGTTFGDLFPSTVYEFAGLGTFSTICTFGGPYANDAGLLQASDGNLYGVTQTGGSYGAGTLFEITPSGTLLSSYTFTGLNDGGYPGGTLIEGPDGTLYGTTQSSGSRQGGTIFKYQKGNLTTLYSFSLNGLINPPSPLGLVLATDGKLYGTTVAGGKQGYGSIFRIATDGTGYQELYSFASGTAQYPSQLMQHTNGLLYGATIEGGRFGYGMLYSLNIGLGSFITFVLPTGKVGRSTQILGQGLTGATSITFNGVPATKFTIVSDTYMTTVVPSGATTGPVVVTTPGGTLTSNRNFAVLK
ncbi:MAG TPA: choice-of-anchor tandem repeat GloVer-containing protein [Candidatus Sulfotelmatobacter sp.]|nr:choice-of-anchor tandem repeat GloVer-containing protein [Candidatus Sulfotelmatobacter sp.]